MTPPAKKSCTAAASVAAPAPSSATKQIQLLETEASPRIVTGFPLDEPPPYIVDFFARPMTKRRTRTRSMNGSGLTGLETRKYSDSCDTQSTTAVLKKPGYLKAARFPARGKSVPHSHRKIERVSSWCRIHPRFSFLADTPVYLTLSCYRVRGGIINCGLMGFLSSYILFDWHACTYCYV